MDLDRISGRQPVFETPWFSLVAKTTGDGAAPHYSVSTADYVSVLAVTAGGEFPLVRQFRPAIERVTLELPSGHVDKGDTPEQAARKELVEETGFVAREMIHLATLSPDTGRLGNRMWCFFASGVARDDSVPFPAEPGVEAVVYRRGLGDLLTDEPAFCSALNRATILMAIAAGHIRL